MKWLNRILGREEIPSTVAFDEIDTWLGMVSKSLFRDLSTNADRLYEEIRNVRERLKQNISELQNAEPDENMPAYITKIGLLNRDKMVKHLYSLTEKISIPTETDYKTVLSFYTVTTSNIEFAFKKSLKNLYYIRSLFPDEVKEVVSDLDRLRTILNQLITPVKGKESQIMNLEHVPEIVRDIKDLKSRIDKEREKVCEQEEKYSALESRIEMEGEKLRMIEEEEEWIRFKEFESELSSLEEDLNALESEVNQLFSPINKTLNILKKRDEIGRHILTPEERKAISSILSSPIRALGEDINEFLLSIRNIIEEDTSILRDKKREKTLKWIDHLLNTELSSIKGRYDLLQSRIGKIKGKLSGLRILKDREEIEESIVSAKK
ncbi:MAG: SPX domain-containing protein, partial [Candidatus Syntropharchaeia archaeon]